ncbi:MAG: hypothetical protein V4693_11540 [Pseudomonadota bacterium]
MYREAGHFKKELGDIVLARVMAEPAGTAAAPVFGARLDPDSVQANVDCIAAERRACAAAHPDMFKAARQLVAKAPVGS